jgi:hypothetical protein
MLLIRLRQPVPCCARVLPPGRMACLHASSKQRGFMQQETPQQRTNMCARVCWLCSTPAYKTGRLCTWLLHLEGLALLLVRCVMQLV